MIHDIPQDVQLLLTLKTSFIVFVIRHKPLQKYEDEGKISKEKMMTNNM